MKKIITIFLILFSVVVLFNLAFAKEGDGDPKDEGLGDPKSTVSLNNPLGSTKDVPTLIGKVINGVLGVVGSLALLMFIYGGFMWMLSAGNEKMVEKGKNTLMWAAAGLVVIFMSYTLVKFIIDQL